MLSDFYRTAELQAGTTESNGRGGQSLTWAKVAGIKILINQASSKDIELAKKRQITATHNGYCATSEPVAFGQVIVQGGRQYRIVSEPKDTVGRGHHYKLLLEAVSLDG